ncbi:MAG: CoA-acylating methylmalonate-semialdehyde dehydrogenase [Planctomycetota bacterium]
MGSARLENLIGGRWVASKATETHSVTNPATGQVIAECPLSPASEVDAAVRAAQEAFPAWRRTPVQNRIQPLFKLKELLEKHAQELAAIVTLENGKTLSESMGSVRRGIQMVEVATGAPSLLMGQSLEDIATGIDCESVRQPLGVFACIAPFNFPAMVPMWFFPFAVACGNTFVCKPSEQTPLSQKLIFELTQEAGFPEGVLNLVNGGKEAVEALLDHPLVRGISFVGSSPVAKLVYTRGCASGKRVQALGGAKNFLIVMPDAEMDAALDAIAESACGCAGERCLATAIVVPVGDCHDAVREGLKNRMEALVVGDGSKAETTMGPLISAAHKERVLKAIARGVEEGAKIVLDGREAKVPKDGFFVGPTLFDNVTQEMTLSKDEIFGPVLCLQPAKTLDEALAMAKAHPLANASSIFTTSGKHARQFRYEVDASMAGVNIGVAAPMSFFSFGGAKGSFFGDLKAHGREAFDFFTDRKVLISRW